MLALSPTDKDEKEVCLGDCVSKVKDIVKVKREEEESVCGLILQKAIGC